jgi:hypothetical protein
VNPAQFFSNRKAYLSVIVFFGVLIAASLWGVSILVANHGLQNEFDTKSRILDGLKGQAVASGAVDRIAAVTHAAAISAPTETVAASELHKNILASLEEAGGSVHSIQAEATTDTIGDGLRRLNAQVAFDSSMGSLQKVLFQLETATPFVFVDSIVVQPGPTSTSGAKIGENLRVTLTVSSYWKSVETSPDVRR